MIILFIIIYGFLGFTIGMAIASFSARKYKKFISFKLPIILFICFAIIGGIVEKIIIGDYDTSYVSKEVTCSFCNGTGKVKYYYGDGDNEYNWGPCTSCDEKGYTVIYVDKKDVNKEVCDSCKESVDYLITKEDNSGEKRSWCENCWNEYESIIGNN